MATESRAKTLNVVREQFGQAIVASKCHASIAQTIVEHHAQGLPAYGGALTDVTVETVRAK